MQKDVDAGVPTRETPRVFVLGSFVAATCYGVPHLPGEGESLLAEGVWSELGGKGLNVGVALHRLGCGVDLLLPVGRDGVAQDLAQALAQEGLANPCLLPIDALSGQGTGFVAPGGRNFLAVFPGANQKLCPESLLPHHDRLAGSAVVYGQLEIPVAVVTAAFALARQGGALTCLNPSPWQTLPRELVDHTDLLIVNRCEARAFLGLTVGLTAAGAEDWPALLARAAVEARAGQAPWPREALVVTLGEAGCVAWVADAGIVSHPGWPVHAQDVTGAGDAFVAGFLAARLAGADVSGALARGCACGALVAAEQGVWAALPRTAAVDQFMLSRMR